MLEGEVQTLDYKGHVIHIVQDMDAEDPRVDDDGEGPCIFWTWHKRYTMGDADTITAGAMTYNKPDADKYHSYDELEAAVRKACPDLLYIHRVYMYDHGGQTINLTGFHNTCDPWGFDSGVLGFILVTRATMARAGFTYKRYTKEVMKSVEELVRSDIEVYDMWLRGDVYGYVIDDDGESCWGYFGEAAAIEEAKGMIDALVKA